MKWKTLSFCLPEDKYMRIRAKLEEIQKREGIPKLSDIFDFFFDLYEKRESLKVEAQVGTVAVEGLAEQLARIEQGIGDLRADLSHVVSKVDEVAKRMKKPKEPVPRRKPYSKIAEEHLRAQAAEEKEDAQWYWDHFEELALRWDTLTERAREAHLRRIRELGLMQHFRFYLERRKGLHRVVV